MTRGPLAKDGAGDAYRILIKPLFSEKTSRMQADGKYVFLVAPGAGKVEIAKSIRDLYGVKPLSVRVLVHKGKSVRHGKSTGREKNEKRAIVKIPKGQTLTVYQGA